MNPTQQFWNERYASEDFVYGTEPNVWFREQLEALPVGRILLPAEGEGRNAVYAARLGWEVFALDLSEKGKEKALKLAANAGVQMQYDLADIRQYPVAENGPWDAVGLFYAHFPPELRAETHLRIAQALRAGGYLILEAFQPEQLNRNSGGPKSADMLYTLDMLRNDFAGLREIHAFLASVELDEGPGHSGVAEVVRLLLQKP
ncbi:MAG: class I SAM-dependent methyltransferase [Chitinophagales bacterium]|nr:class I SAM-dependent methyltransferase [Chitinophagales bacterium]